MMRSIGKNIKLFRQKAGMTQERLAERVGVSVNHISCIERGIYRGSLETFVKIINALGCTADDLFADVIEHGHRQRSSRLLDEIEQLDKDEQRKILDVIEVLIRNAK